MNRAGRALGFSWPVLIGLAALAVPRVVLHDIGAIEEGSFVNGLFVFVPPACWIAAVLWSRARRPFGTIVVIGAISGVFLAVGHQLLWSTAFGGDTPALGGALAGADPAVSGLAMRAAAALSSVATGTIVGVITGAVAVLLCRVVSTSRDDAVGGEGGGGRG